MASETELQAAIVKTLAALGIRTVRTHAGSVNLGGRWMRFGDPGTPDLVVVDPYMWLEVKLPGGRLSKAQQEWHDWAERHGVPILVVRSVDDAVRAVAERRKHGGT